MSADNMKNFARKMYYEDDFFLLACRNPGKAIDALGGDAAFTADEQQQIADFAAGQGASIGAAIDQLGGGGIIDLGNGGCGVWC